uniref:Uncharacterized protein n=1 Tax=Anguilla anguilla TaxID=7936 RepID=A0A0E9R4H5_ANGAN
MLVSYTIKLYLSQHSQELAQLCILMHRAHYFR